MDCVDDNGYVFFVDRIKNRIVNRGENIYSAEVESAISTHIAVAQVAVIGIPDEKCGEAVHAVAVLSPGKTVSEKKSLLIAEIILPATNFLNQSLFDSSLCHSPVQ